MGILTSIRMGASVKISSGPSGHQHSQSQRCCCLFAPYFVIQIRTIHWYRKLQEYSKLTEKSILIWQGNGRGNMPCDEKFGGQKNHKKTAPKTYNKNKKNKNREISSSRFLFSHTPPKEKKIQIVFVSTELKNHSLKKMIPSRYY